MEHEILAATPRTATGKQVRALRRSGQIPAVLYGHKQDNQNLSVDAREFTKLYAHAGSSTLVDLQLDGKRGATVLIHDVQLSPVRREVEHVDLFAVNLKEKLKTAIPLEFAGTSEAVETLGGILNTQKDEVEVECLPDKLVTEITVDLSQLNTFEDTIKVSDLMVPEGITVLDDADDLVVSVTDPSTQDLDLDTEIVDNAAEVPAETEDGHTGPEEEEKNG